MPQKASPIPPSRERTLYDHIVVAQPYFACRSYVRRIMSAPPARSNTTFISPTRNGTSIRATSFSTVSSDARCFAWVRTVGSPPPKRPG